MSYHLSTLVPDRVILLRVEGAITLEELAQLDHDLWDNIERFTSPVHVIVDLHEMTDFPKKVMDLRRVLPRLNTDKMGWMILISRNRIANFVSSIILNLRRIKFRTFDDRNEAMRFLYEHDSSLNEPANKQH